MKNYCGIFLIIFFVCENGRGQSNSYHPFPETNALWNENFMTYSQNTVLTDTYGLFYSGDTIIGGRVYHKILKSGFVQGTVKKNQYMGALRQDSIQKKVYFISATAQNEQLLYNFNLSVGNVLPQSFNNTIFPHYVSAIDSVLVGNNYHKRFLLDSLGANNAIIEGFGSSFGLYNTIQGPVFEPSTWSDLVCFNGDGKNYPANLPPCQLLEITVPELEKTYPTIYIFPNPSSAYVTILSQKDFDHASVDLYNTLGQKIMQVENICGQSITLTDNELKPGIYFLNLVQKGNLLFSHKIIINQF